MQIVVTLIRRRRMWRLIWAYTVCQCSFYRTLDINGLIMYTFWYILKQPWHSYSDFENIIKRAQNLRLQQISRTTGKGASSQWGQRRHNLIVPSLAAYIILPCLASSFSDCVASLAELGVYCLYHYENTPIQIYWKFHHQTLKSFQIKILIFIYFCSKHRLWVLVRTASPRRC